MPEADPSLFYNELECIITIHVDGLISAGNEHFFKNVISKIHGNFTVEKECNTAFQYLGLDLKEHKNCISLDQTHIKLLDTINHKNEKLCIHDAL